MMSSEVGQALAGRGPLGGEPGTVRRLPVRQRITASRVSVLDGAERRGLEAPMAKNDYRRGPSRNLTGAHLGPLRSMPRRRLSEICIARRAAPPIRSLRAADA